MGTTQPVSVTASMVTPACNLLDVGISSSSSSSLSRSYQSHSNGRKCGDGLGHC